MRSNPVAYRLTFLLPEAHAAPADGARLPDERGCVLEVHRAGLVQIRGPAREAVFDRAIAFVRDELENCARPTSIAAVLASPRGRDSWSIIIGADVALSPTSLPPFMPVARPPPVLQLVTGGVRDQGERAGDIQGRQPASA